MEIKGGELELLHQPKSTTFLSPPPRSGVAILEQSSDLKNHIFR